MQESIQTIQRKSLNQGKVSKWVEQLPMRTHSLKVCLNRDEQQSLFTKVETFVKSLITDIVFKDNLAAKINKNENSCEKRRDNFVQRGSFKRQQKSKIFMESQELSEEHKISEKSGQKKRTNRNKKLSILIFEEIIKEKVPNQCISQGFLSDISVKTIRSIDIPPMELNSFTITLIYETPQPLIVTLSLCLFVRYCLRTKRQVKLSESAWVLCMSTIGAYKLSYDQQVQGLMDCFTQIMRVDKNDLFELQRCFYSEIDYDTYISNSQFYVIMELLESLK